MAVGFNENEMSDGSIVFHGKHLVGPTEISPITERLYSVRTDITPALQWPLMPYKEQSRAQVKYCPPLTLMISPVIQAAPGEHNHRAAEATSAG